MNAPASGDSFTLSAVEVRGRNAQLTNELKAGGRNGRMKATSPSLRTCGCSFSADPQRLYHEIVAIAIKAATKTWRVGAATAGGSERSSIRMHNRNDTTLTIEDSCRTGSGCHGCHAPVTPRGVTPSGPFQTFYQGIRGGVTGVTARFQLIARTQACVCTPTLARITRDSAVTPVTPPVSRGLRTSPGRKGVTPPGVTPRDPPVTPQGWSA